MKRRAIKLVDGLNSLEGVSCNQPQGAMYAFPQVRRPPWAIAAAEPAINRPPTLHQPSTHVPSTFHQPSINLPAGDAAAEGHCGRRGRWQGARLLLRAH